MGRVLRALTTVFFVVCTIIAYGASMVGTMQSNKETGFSKQYIIPAAVFNTFAVGYILYLMITNNTRYTNPAIALASILLIGGLIAETYITILLVDLPDEIANYVILSFNLIVRLYYIIDMGCVIGIPTILGPVQQKVVSTASQPASVGNVDKLKELKDKLKAYYDKVAQQTNGRRILGNSKGDANILLEAANKSGSLTNDTLRDAIAKLRFEDAPSVPVSTVVAIGGRRR
jgi:hypothetical protein